MRDANRIPEVLKKIHEAWSLTPDLRFNQLMCSINEGKDNFYMEDDKLIESIDSWIEAHK